MENNSVYKLVNPSFQFEFGGRIFDVKKANFEMALKYQIRAKELSNAKELELNLAPYCIYLVLHKVDETITEEWVKENLPADTDYVECLEKMGFISQSKLEIVQKARKEMESK
jgi:hypothetical protein